MTFRRATPLVVLFLGLGIVASRGDDGDSIKTKLDKARSAYESEKEAIRKSILELFDKRETEAREKGDKKLVDLIKAERQVFEERPEIPKWVPLAIQRRAILARETMITAYQTAVKEFLKAKKDDEAALVEKELKLFQEAGTTPVKPPVNPVADSLQVGTLWSGTRVATNTIPWSLKVLRREGNRFSGEITIDKTRTYMVEGAINGEKITFTTEKKGKFQQTCDGQIKGEEITLTFSGIDFRGDAIRGTAKLTLKK